jgi:hypothetical protein
MMDHDQDSTWRFTTDPVSDSDPTLQVISDPDPCLTLFASSNIFTFFQPF